MINDPIPTIFTFRERGSHHLDVQREESGKLFDSTIDTSNLSAPIDKLRSIAASLGISKNDWFELQVEGNDKNDQLQKQKRVVKLSDLEDNQQSISCLLSICGFENIKIVKFQQNLGRNITPEQCEFLARNGFISNGRITDEFYQIGNVLSRVNCYDDLRMVDQIYKVSGYMFYPDINEANYTAVLRIGLENSDLGLSNKAANWIKRQIDQSDCIFEIDQYEKTLVLQLMTFPLHSLVVNLLENLPANLVKVSLCGENASQQELEEVVSKYGSRISLYSGCELSVVPAMKNLESLQLEGGNDVLIDLGTLPGSLTELYIEQYESLQEIEGFECLKKLTIFSISDCSSLKKISKISGLLELEAFTIKNCPDLQDSIQLEDLPHLSEAEITNCANLTAPPKIENCPKFCTLDLSKTGIFSVPKLPRLSVTVEGCLNLAKPLPEDPEQRARSGDIYICSGIELDPESGGRFYRMELRNEFLTSTEMDDIEKQLFPAVQPHLEEISFTNNEKFFKFLGYEKISETMIVLPDVRILNHRWGKLREDFPFLPEFTFISSQGIADDRSFIQAFTQNKLICSDKEEFIHDQLIHLIQVIELALSTIDGDSQVEVWPCVQMLQHLQSKTDTLNTLIDALEKGIEDKTLSLVARTYLGMFVDAFTVLDHRIELKTAIDLNFNLNFLYSDSDWQDYLERHYGPDYQLNEPRYLDVWRYLVSIVDTPEAFSVDKIKKIIEGE